MSWCKEHKKSVVICGVLFVAFLAGGYAWGFWTVLPYAIIALCPLMHLFMMHGHPEKKEGEKSCH